MEAEISPSGLPWVGVQQLVPSVNIEATATGLPRLCAPAGTELPSGFGVVNGWPPSALQIIRPPAPSSPSPPQISNGYYAAC